MSWRKWGAALALGLLVTGCAAAPAPPIGSPAATTSTPPNPPTPRGTSGNTPSPDAPASALTVPPPAPRDTRKGAALDRPFTVEGVPVVSKAHPISGRYSPRGVAPHGLTRETQRALTTMIAAARKAGVRVVVKSGYRSYRTQAGILQAKIREYGDESLARRYNAAPGRSEHQTGLAVDLYDGVTWGLAVRNTRTGRWLWANAPRYGFILRYPPGKEKVTGYAYEPWHFRFIGVQHSRNFGAESSETLEEYLHLR